MGPRSWRVQTRWIRACESIQRGHKPRDPDSRTSICGAWDPLHRREGASPMHEGSTWLREGTTCTREGARVIAATGTTHERASRSLPFEVEHAAEDCIHFEHGAAGERHAAASAGDAVVPLTVTALEVL